MMTPPLNSLRAFEAAARLGTFKAAADALCVTQSAISHQIRNVEEWIGKPLFAREGNRTQLLPDGVDLARSLSTALVEIETACHRVRARPASQALVIAAIPSVAMCWLIPRLSRFRAAHPGIETRVIYAMHGRDINFQDAHLAFVFSAGPPVISNVEAQLFLAGRSVPVCSPGLLRSLDHHPRTVADFRQLGLLHDCDTSGWKAWLQEAEADTGATFEDFNLLRAAALSGQGVALCALAMVAPDLAAGSLVQLSDRTTLDEFDYYMLSVTSAGPQALHQAQVFRDWAMEERDRPLTNATVGQI